MSRRFNLLPAPYAERIAERRMAAMTGGALVCLVAVLVLAGFNQGRLLRRSTEERDVERARLDALVAQRTQLVRFRQLTDGISARERLLTAAMRSEVSWATVLTSLAAHFPSDASLTSLTVETHLPAFGGASVKPGDQASVIGSGTVKGYSVRKFTPGVERLLQLLETVTGLAEPRLRVGTREEIGKQPVTTFEGTAFLDAAALSGRYLEGLPPEDAIDIPQLAGGTASVASTAPVAGVPR